jgi:hypothetical protein
MAKQNWTIKSITPVGKVGNYDFPSGFDPSSAPREAPQSSMLPTGFSSAFSGSPYGTSSAGRQIAERGYYDFGPSRDMGYGGSGGGGGGGGGTIGGGYNPMMAMEYRRQQRMAEEAMKKGVAGLRGLVGSYNRAYRSARSANERRYQQLLDIASQTTAQREADIRADYAGKSADIRQRLARQGMAGTTIAPTMEMGVQREQQSSLNRLADMMQQTKLGIIERREDRYPDAGVVTGLASMLGQGGGAAGIGGALSALGGLRM